MQPLATFTSHIAGRNARVTIWPDRIEWTRPGRTTAANILLIFLAFSTCFLTLLAPACRPRFAPQGHKMLAMRAIQAVSSHREGLHTAVSVAAGAESISFRVAHHEAAGIEGMLRQLVLGQHPAQMQQPGPAPRW